jgi:hypothetical protein
VGLVNIISRPHNQQDKIWSHHDNASIYQLKSTLDEVHRQKLALQASMEKIEQDRATSDDIEDKIGVTQPFSQAL